MKILSTVARILLGLIFFIFGLNGFLQFIPTPPLSGLSGEFIHALMTSHYVFLISGIQLVSGVLLLINRFVPLALALLAPVIVNILTYHLTMDPKGFPPAILVTVLWVILIWRFREYFAPLFAQRAEPKP